MTNKHRVEYFKPFDLDGNIGNAYNRSMSLLQSDDDWACLMDGDVMFLLNNYGHHINDIINKYPDAGVITCKASRTGTGPQKQNGISKNPNMMWHFRIAERLQREKYWEVMEIGRYAGFLQIIRKGVWKDIGGFDENCGIFEVDKRFCRKVLASKRKILCMQGLYVLHYYRLGLGGPSYKKHVYDNIRKYE